MLQSTTKNAMKFLIDFMVDAAERAKEQEQVKQPWRRKRTQREVLEALRLAENGPGYPHHHYTPHQNVLNLKKLIPSSGEDQEIAPKKRRVDSDSSDHDFVIRDAADQEKKPCPNAVVIRETEKIEKKEKKKCTIPNADESKSEEKAKKRKGLVAVNLQEPELPAELRARMTAKAREFGQDDVGRVALVIQKVLQMSDIAKQQNRLTIPKKQVKEEFLRPEQEEYLSEKDGNHTTYVEVPVMEPTGGVAHLTLRRWDVGKKSVSYILNGDWKDVVSLNKLREGQIVAVWAFWIKRSLNFALVFSDNPATATETETGTGTGSENSNLRSGRLDFDLNMEPE